MSMIEGRMQGQKRAKNEIWHNADMAAFRAQKRADISRPSFFACRMDLICLHPFSLSWLKRNRKFFCKRRNMFSVLKTRSFSHRYYLSEGSNYPWHRRQNCLADRKLQFNIWPSNKRKTEAFLFVQRMLDHVQVKVVAPDKHAMLPVTLPLANCISVEGYLVTSCRVLDCRTWLFWKVYSSARWKKNLYKMLKADYSRHFTLRYLELDGMIMLMILTRTWKLRIKIYNRIQD